MAERTSIQHTLSAEIDIEPEKSVAGGYRSQDSYAHFFFNMLLSHEDVERKFFLCYPEVARVQFFVDDVIRMDLRRPDGVEEETRKTLETIGEKLYGFEPLASAVPGIVGTASQGPVGESVRVESWEECVRIFGEPTDDPASLSGAAKTFFHNCGRACIASRMVELPEAPATGEADEESSTPAPCPGLRCLQCGLGVPLGEMADHQKNCTGDKSLRLCPLCNGTGQERFEAMGKRSPQQMPCSRCSGTGTVPEKEAKTCTKCGGSGFGETFGGVPSYCKGCDGNGKIPIGAEDKG